MVKNRAAIYARFSSHNQRSESIEIQVENSRAFCEREGLQVVREYCDYAQTGRNIDRAEFQRMMNDARHGLFDYVVIYKVTRIMRNRDEMSLARIMLRKAGVEILYAGEDISSGSSGVLQLGMLEVLAEYESALDSERIRDGIQKNAQRCMANGRTLYGWDIVEGRYVINEREASVLRKMKNMLFAGSSVADIVRAVSAERSKRGAKFNQDTVTKLLKRVQNAGVYKYAGHEVPDGMPAIWSQVEQDMIDNILCDRHKPRRKINSTLEFPLSGKLYCSKCGSPMAGTSGTSCTGATYHYYKCRNCRRTVRRDLVEDVVCDMTLQAVAREDVRRRIVSGMVEFQEEQPKEQSRSYAIKKELKRIDRTFERIWQAIEDGIAPPGGRERTEELKQRKSELEAELRIAEREEAFNIGVDELMLWLDDAAENLTPEVILGTFVRFVEIDGKTLNVYFAFDHYGDGFRPKQKKAELCPEGHSSTNSLMVEAAKIELEKQERIAAEKAEEAARIKAEAEQTIQTLEATLQQLDAEAQALLVQEQEAARAAEAAAAAAEVKRTYAYSTPSASIPSQGSVVDYALSRIGCPYVWGAAGPNEFDCSGLVTWAYAQVGISVPHQTESMYYAAAARLPVSEAQPGDVLWISYGDGYNGHAGIACNAGGTHYVHAPTFGARVRNTDPLSWAGFTHALRFA